MNAISMNNLWLYLQSLSLSANNKRWLGERLIDSASVAKKKSEKEKKLEALTGSWDNANGDKIAQAIMDGRKSDYEREIEPLTLTNNG